MASESKLALKCSGWFYLMTTAIKAACCGQSPVVILEEFLSVLIGSHTAQLTLSFLLFYQGFFFLMASHVFQVDFKVPL